jgi:hypothetical protein
MEGAENNDDRYVQSSFRYYYYYNFIYFFYLCFLSFVFFPCSFSVYCRGETQGNEEPIIDMTINSTTTTTTTTSDEFEFDPNMIIDMTEGHSSKSTTNKTTHSQKVTETIEVSSSPSRSITPPSSGGDGKKKGKEKQGRGQGLSSSLVNAFYDILSSSPSPPSSPLPTTPPSPPPTLSPPYSRSTLSATPPQTTLSPPPSPPSERILPSSRSTPTSRSSLPIPSPPGSPLAFVYTPKKSLNKRKQSDGGRFFFFVFVFTSVNFFIFCARLY